MSIQQRTKVNNRIIVISHTLLNIYKKVRIIKRMNERKEVEVKNIQIRGVIVTNRICVTEMYDLSVSDG